MVVIELVAGTAPEHAVMGDRRFVRELGGDAIEIARFARA
jgi:hypothetical protein